MELVEFIQDVATCVDQWYGDHFVFSHWLEYSVGCYESKRDYVDHLTTEEQEEAFLAVARSASFVQCANCGSIDFRDGSGYCCEDPLPEEISSAQAAEWLSEIGVPVGCEETALRGVFEAWESGLYCAFGSTVRDEVYAWLDKFARAETNLEIVYLLMDAGSLMHHQGSLIQDHLDEKAYETLCSLREDGLRETFGEEAVRFPTQELLDTSFVYIFRDGQ